MQLEIQFVEFVYNLQQYLASLYSIIIGNAINNWSIVLGVYYLSVAAAGFLVFIIVLAIIKYILFVLMFILTAGKLKLWIFPNLTEDVGFFESFVPVYVYTYDKPKKDKDSDDEESSEEEDDDEKGDDLIQHVKNYQI